jgi:hypothetical protein
MPQTLLTLPIGTTGNLSITESAGTVTISFSENAAKLLTALATSQTNTTLKDVLSAIAAYATALPA